VETTALGVAGLAGLAAGVWQDAEEFLETRTFTRFTPQMARGDAERLVIGWQRAVGAAVAWARDEREVI
jgi:glycerol kinase